MYLDSSFTLQNNVTNLTINLPTAYKHIMIVGNLSTSDTNQSYRINSAQNVEFAYIQGTAGQVAGAMSTNLIGVSDSTKPYHSPIIIVLPGYQEVGQAKPILLRSVSPRDYESVLAGGVMHTTNTDAINSITITRTVLANSQFSIYGWE